MNDDRTDYCCDDCFGFIAEVSPDAACLWIELCRINLTSKIFGLKMTDFPALQLLEMMGFITTTDTDEMIVVKVHGRRADNNGHFFCMGKCTKEKPQVDKKLGVNNNQ